MDAQGYEDGIYIPSLEEFDRMLVQPFAGRAYRDFGRVIRHEGVLKDEEVDCIKAIMARLWEDYNLHILADLGEL